MKRLPLKPHAGFTGWGESKGSSSQAQGNPAPWGSSVVQYSAGPHSAWLFVACHDPVPRWQNSSLYQILSLRQPHNSQNGHRAQAGTSPPGPHSDFGQCWLQLCMNKIPAKASVSFPPVPLSECLVLGLMCHGIKLPGEFCFDETLALTLHRWLGTLA